MTEYLQDQTINDSALSCLASAATRAIIHDANG